MMSLKKQILVWGLVGLVSNGIDYTIFLVCHRLSGSIPLSNLLSVLTSSVFNFYMHRTRTFQNNSRLGPQIWRYLSYQVLIWILGTGLITLLHHFGAPIGTAKLLPLIIIAPVNYFSLKYIVYKFQA
jgi:putative flippase GtrA